MVCCAPKRSPEEARAHYIEQRLRSVGGLYQAASLLAEHRALLQGSLLQQTDGSDLSQQVRHKDHDVAQKKCKVQLDELYKQQQIRTQMTEKVDKLLKEIEEAKKQLDSNTQRKQAADGALQQAKAMIEKLRAEANRLKATRDQLLKEVEEIRMNAAVAWKQAEHLWKQVQECDDKTAEVCAKIQQELAQLHRENGIRTQKINSNQKNLEKSKISALDELNRAKMTESELEKAKTDIQELQNLIERYNNEIASLQKALAAATDDSTKANDEVTKAKKRRDEICVDPSSGATGAAPAK